MKIRPPLIAAMFALGMHYCKAQSISQDAIATTGNCFTTPDVSLSWTLGEPISETDASPANFLTQGFQQPQTIIVTDVTNVTSGSGNLSAYPNPFTSTVSLQNNDGSETLNVELVDMNGKTVLTKTMETKQEQFDLSAYANGIYFLRVYGTNNKLVQTLKINKIK